MKKSANTIIIRSVVRFCNVLAHCRLPFLMICCYASYFLVPITHADDWLFGGSNANFKAHCPYAGEFTMAIIQPVENNQFLLECLNQAGNIYHSETGSLSIDPTDKAWYTQSYPPMWVCSGHLVEDCGFFNGMG